MAKTLEELRKEYPEQIAQAETEARASADHTEAVNAAVHAERTRMQEIDEVACLLDPASVREAKYGDKPCTAAELVMADAKKRAKQGEKFMAEVYWKKALEGGYDDPDAIVERFRRLKEAAQTPAAP